MRKGPAAVLAAVCVGSVLAGACASESDVNLPAQPGTTEPDDAPTSTTPGTLSPEGDQPGEAPPAPEDVGAALEDAVETTRSVQTATVDTMASLEAQGTAVTAEVHSELHDDGSGSIEGTAASPGSDPVAMQLRATDRKLWLSLPDVDGFQSALPDGVSWVEIPRDRAPGLVPAVSLAETWRLLAVIYGLGDAEDQGVTADNNDIPLRTLAGDVDIEAVRARASEQELTTIEGIFDLSGDSDLSATVGIDGDGRVRQLEIVATTPISGRDATATTTVSLDVDAFNRTLDLPGAPSGDDAVPLGQVPEVESFLTQLG